MRTLPSCLLLAGLVLVPAPASAGAPPRRAEVCVPHPDGDGKACIDAAPVAEDRSGFPAAAPAAAEAPADTDVQHYRLEIEVIPESTQGTITAVRVEGTSTIDLEPAVDGLTTFTVDLHAPLAVTAVTGDVAGWLRVGDTVEITLDRAYDTGEAVQVAVSYGGYPEANGYGAFSWWLREGQLVVATLSQPYFAHYWWPTKDQLDDKASFEALVTVPDPLVALSNGVELAPVPIAGARTQYRWQETSPMIPYLASLAIADYRRYDLLYDWDDGGQPATMPVPCYVYADHWDDVAGEPLSVYKNGCDELPGMLTTLAGLFGEYPFVDEKYGVVETGGTGGLTASMEHQTLSSMSRVDSYSVIMSHEAAHQWWGDLVTCETWYDIWLNEGFATYSEALYREFRVGGSKDLFWTRIDKRRPSDPDRRVYRDSIDSTSAIFGFNAVYLKGAWVVHMLRGVIGDAAFFRFLADYRAAFADDSATTAEFTEALSASFGQDLSWFTDQWVMGTGSPDYEWNHAAETIAGETWLKLAVWQRQDLDGYDLFTMPLRVRVTTAAGTTVHTIWNDGWEEHYVLPTDGLATSVELDAEDGIDERNWVLFDSRVLVATPLDAPPVLLRADFAPAPSPGADTTVVLTFSEDVGGFDASDVRLTGDASGVHVPAPVVWDGGARQATLTFASLPEDAFTLEVLAAGVLANGHALDGETDVDAWWDDVVLPSGDGQPGGDAVLAFAIDWPQCDDGRDNDGDGYVDHPADPGCRLASDDREAAQCQDGVSNDGDGLIDFDGGLSILGYAATDPDPHCVGKPWRDRETAPQSCGLGVELALLLPLWLWRRRARAGARR